MNRIVFLALSALSLLAAVGCSSDSESETATGIPDDAEAADGGPLFDLASPAESAEIQTDPPEGLVILDVRTPEEFNSGYLQGATMIDFYASDFTDRLAELDRDVPYLVYCRSGNRSGQTINIMKDLGFTNVTDIDGGITAWAQADLPIVGG